MFDDFDFFSGLDDPRGPREPLGAFWHIMIICGAVLLFIGLLKWMS